MKVKGRIRTYMRFSIYLGFLLLAVTLAMYLIDLTAALILTAFTVLYFAITLTLYFYNKPVIMNELVSFATEYGQIQRKLLRELDIPYALLDEDGRIMWTNIAFETITHQPKGYNKSITTPPHSSPLPPSTFFF